MFRLRRYRYYVFFAAIIVFLLYRVSQNSDQWESVSAAIPYKAPPKSSPERGFGTTNKQSQQPLPGKSGSRLSDGDSDSIRQGREKTIDDTNEVKIPSLKPTTSEDVLSKFDPSIETATTDAGRTKVMVYDKDGAAKTTTVPLIDIPDKNVGQGAKGKGVHGKPGTHKSKPEGEPPKHWKKFPEHFPVPEDEIIPLPTGKPKPIPAVQYDFDTELPQVREKRLERLAKVKAEMVRGWNGYMTYAKGHDELSPVSKKFRDPFCGWAATLVDALDTLWIMGMKEEFEEALLEVEKIDFTTSEYRSEIPVFETTIRYLGGLVAAYDVSGGKAGGYDILLEKALELAEILMGVFDTPNRMPILYYNWKPSSVSLPKRAQGASVAELGSLAMEFTRLAQITKENRYYDAVARITDAFYEWQERGTAIPGIFPEHIDASGCNRTAEAIVAAQEAEEEEQRQVELQKSGSDTAKSKAIEVDGSQSKSGKGEFHALESRSQVGTPNDDGTKSVKIVTNGEEIYAPSEKTASPKSDKGKSSTVSRSHSNDSEEPKKKDKCIPQGLTSGSFYSNQQYSMGGSQDSTYEYFPKQWLLLGGLEPKYEILHTKVAAAVKKWLLFRPMVPDDRDILFSAKINTRGSPETDASTEWEVTHLTCFLGGMFGLGGKIFKVPEDVEIGKKLTDGCVWAYESTPSGIMPEGSTVVPCAEANNCHWNETLYWQWLDPLHETHDEEVMNFEKEQKERKAKKLLNTEKATMKGHPNLGTVADGTVSSKDGSGSVGIHKRAPPSPIRSSTDDTTGESVQAPLQPEEDDSEVPEPIRPLSSKEYAENRIQSDNLPPGFVSANYHAYILRPEAIESVWYMYRITGDSSWQEKGWKMFNAIVSQTRTEAGSSAIDNVLLENPVKTDEMESFWLAETLKYFYLLYSDPNLISLDEWVLNTEAHPFKRPV
ncbi:putative endoplasmic reticulum mannosidase MNL2 [Daldinia childiae]|uniref:putative endoplasmic reticulum mannosidase MNL2 n=1 Tax=Daldinia childiae TaxID=326645 RepID=UPI0014486AF6|nr:putative endoplasmic reticulum mannosidase MNL2 [Daldinia childiae]KAF3067284.1 putative endoplasmic reticulum mannosidase MNL2 [Daldinia childiae]